MNLLFKVPVEGVLGWLVYFGENCKIILGEVSKNIHKMQKLE